MMLLLRERFFQSNNFFTKFRLSVFLLYFPLALVNSCKEYQSNVFETAKVSDNQSMASIVNSHNRDFNDKNIIAGKRVGNLLLGYTKEQIIQLLGKPDEEYNYDGYEKDSSSCIRTELHWLNRSVSGGNGIYIYLRNEVVFQIKVSIQEYSTPERASSEMPMQEVMEKYSHIVKYKLTDSGSENVGGKDLLYLVEQNKGIAFEAYFNKREQQRRISDIFVFKPKELFLPDGCVSTPQTFVKLENNFPQ